MQEINQENMTTVAWTVLPTAWSVRAMSWWARIARLGRKSPRRLRLAESLPLGERRFVAVIEFEGARFLLGGTSSLLVLLARLDTDPENSPADGQP
jgi:flagellar biogenesis protein FliO